jgi:putative membrane protein
MAMFAIILICICAAVHFYFMYLEMIVWEAPRTRKIFGQTAESAASTKASAANQGLYNGVIAGGLLLSLALGTTVMTYYLLIGIVSFGIYAYLTVTKRALVVQSAPACLAILALLFGV